MPIQPDQQFSFSSGIGYSTAGQYWSLHAPRGFSQTLCGPDLFVCDGGTSLVCRGRGMPCQGALIVGAPSRRMRTQALVGHHASAASSPHSGSASCSAAPCYFAGGSRQWFRLTSLRQHRLDGFLAFVATKHYDDGHADALAAPLDFFHPPSPTTACLPSSAGMAQAAA